ncbi:hypothetical protein NCC49_004056 [Naganishia albida]|nr:hypothetical protein NCC49_004056 [Naganishia albida]
MLGVSVRLGPCTLGTFFDYTSNPYFILGIGNEDNNKHEYLKVHVHSGTKSHDVRGLWRIWVQGLQSLSQKKGAELAVREGRADLVNMRGLTSWKEVIEYMKTSPDKKWQT